MKVLLGIAFITCNRIYITATATELKSYKPSKIKTVTITEQRHIKNSSTAFAQNCMTSELNHFNSTTRSHDKRMPEEIFWYAYGISPPPN